MISDAPADRSLGSMRNFGPGRWRLPAVAWLLIAGLALPCGAAPVDLVIDHTTLVLDGQHVYASVQVVNGGTLTHSPGSNLVLIVTGAVNVDASSSIDVSGKGLAAGTAVEGTGPPATGRAGGSHGGYGFAAEWTTNPATDDPRDPLQPGAGAGPDDGGGHGGGVVRIGCASLTLDGSIRADGADGAAAYPNGGGGGAGGSIRIDTGVLQGLGEISAAGGRGNIHCYYGCRTGGSGGGGRIALYSSSAAFDLAHVTAQGGEHGASDSGAGGVGTVYLQPAGAPSELRIAGSVTSPGAWTPLGLPGDGLVSLEGLVLSGSGVVAAPEHDMPIVATSATLSDGALLTHASCTASETHELRLIVRGPLTIDATSSIDVSGRGFVAGRTLGNRYFGAAFGVAGGGHGGVGGLASNLTYGNALRPDKPGSGGGTGGPSGSGGGVAHVAATWLSLAGSIRADGANGGGSWGNGAGGGSGGSVVINASTLDGTGFVSADGGDASYECYYGCRTGGSGGGGRVAIHALDRSSFEDSHATADAGVVAWVDDAATGDPGTVTFPSEPLASWTAPQGDLLHDQEILSWEILGIPSDGLHVDVAADGPGQAILATDAPAVGALGFPTASVADGVYDLTATFQDAGHADVMTATRRVLVDNGVAWHGGRIPSDETWPAGVVHVVERNVVVAAGATLTLAPGAIVKFAQGTGLETEAGGAIAGAALADAPIVLTSLRDDGAGAGGDTNRDAGASLPRFGDWDGVTGAATLSGPVELRFARAGHSGTLAIDETWSAAVVHEIRGDVVVPAGRTLIIAPGAVVHVGRLLGITVQAGGTLLAEGTTALPIVITSVAESGLPDGLDPSGGPSAPAAGDWRWIRVDSGTASFDHVRMSYGGGTASRIWEETGMIRTSGTASVSIRNSVLRDAFFDGILAWGGSVTVTSTILTGIDRAICAHPGSIVTVTNCTLDDDRIGLLVHGGTLHAVNDIVSNAFESGIQYDFGTLGSVGHCDVWSDAGGSVDYRGTADRTGANGNVSVDPRFADAARGDYRLGYESPAIDAADGTAAPALDAAGAPRYDDPRSPNTGLSGPGGTWADMGAREFVETAESDVNLVITSVTGPAAASPGDVVTLDWTVSNQGTGTVHGPWHDALALVRDPGGLPLDVPIALVLSGEGLTLRPGEVAALCGDARIPPTTVGPHAFQVVVNARGDVFEGMHAADNAALADAPVVIDLPELVVDGPSTPGQFPAAGAWRAYKVLPAPGTGFRIELDRHDDSGATDVLVRAGAMPTADRFDRSSADWEVPDASVTVPDASPVIHYVLARARAAAGPVSFSIRAVGSQLGITSVSPARGGTGGSVTLTIRGEELPAAPVVSLVASSGATRIARSVARPDASKIVATFDLSGMPEGLADVLVEGGGGGSASLPDAFEIIAGGSPGFWFEVAGPRVVRAGRQATLDVRWGNRGSVDAPMRLVDAGLPGGTTLRLDPFGRPVGERILILTAARDCPEPVMPPGWSDSRSVFVTAMPIAEFRFGPSAVAIDDPALAAAAVDWDALAAIARPEGLEDADWLAYWSELTGRLGPTWASMLQALGDDAVAMSVEPGAPSSSDARGGVLLLQALLWEMDEAMRAIGWSAAAVAPAASPSSPLRVAKIAPQARRIKSLLVSIGEGGGTESDIAHPEDSITRMERFLEGTAQQPWYRNESLVDRPGRADDDLSVAAISGGLQSLADRTGPGEVGLFYYTGHGGASSLSTKSDALPFAELHRILEGALTRTSPPPAAKMVVVLDSCFSGGFIDYLRAAGADPDKWVVMTAAATTERAYQPVLSPFDVGFFTQGLIDRLGKGGSLHAAYDDLPDNLNSGAWHEQTAQFYGNDTSLSLQDPDGKSKHDVLGPDGLGAAPPPGSGPCPSGAPGGASPADCDPRIQVASSFDPNEKSTQGKGVRGYVQPDQRITFTIFFENDPDHGATAPVQELLVTDQLAAQLDWSSVEIGLMGFGDERIAPPEGRDAYRTIANRAGDPNPVKVEASLDRQSGLLTWKLASLDPSTQLLPEDPLAGFLPVDDDAGAGQGFVSFTVRSLPGLPNGTEIVNGATITFDPTLGVNPPLVTNETLNVIGDPPACAGDCDRDGLVGLSELALGRDLALQRPDAEACAAADADGSGTVTVRDLVTAIRASLLGCPE